jgi:signal transduction histidine kinase/CheY-like chemotaxis protein
MLAASSGILAWLFLPSESFPVGWFGITAVMVGLSMGVRLMAARLPAVTRYCLALLLVLAVLAAMWLYADTWVPFVGLLLVPLGAALVSGGGLVTAVAVASLSTVLALNGVRDYPLAHLLTMLALSAVSARLLVSTLYTALDWAWSMQQRADHHLAEARDNRAQLSRALHSHEKTNWILQRTRRELIIARREAEEARLMKEQFAANISHELRTPLNLIFGFSELMYLSSDIYGEMSWPPALRQDIYQVYQNSRHLLEMIGDVLDLSRFEMTGFTLQKEPTALEPLVLDTTRIVEGFFHNRPVELSVYVSPDLPLVDIDRTRVRQILLNLLNNAQRFTEEGHVRVAAIQEDGHVVVSVSDTGRGIPAVELPRVFEEFYQVDRSLDRRRSGAGLGLAICKNFVEAHGGQIWAESEEGAGSTFCFTLPLPDQSVPLIRVATDRHIALSHPEPQRPILVVDPDPTVADVVRRHIPEYGVVHIACAEDLLEQVQLHHPQVVVRNAPPQQRTKAEDGLEDAKGSLPVPVIECSLPSHAWARDSLAVVACLDKPITSDGLLAEIGKLGTVHDVLVVDDDRGFCQLVARMLEASGRKFTVRQAYDGAEALQELAERRPDVMLLDLILPGVDGFQVLETMRNDPAHTDVPVIVLTATSLAEDLLEQRNSRVVIGRPDGLTATDVIRCLRAVIEVLEPRYDERASPFEAPDGLQTEAG